MTGFNSKRQMAQAKLEPTQWRNMVVVTLVREGINKHRARELADHFAITPTPAEYAQGYAEGFNDACKKPEQEPVAWAVQGITQMIRGEFAELDAKSKARRIGGTCVAYPLYTTPPKRQWQGLTDDEIEMIEAGIGYMGRSVTAIIKEAEAKLKERNT